MPKCNFNKVAKQLTTASDSSRVIEGWKVKQRRTKITLSRDFIGKQVFFLQFSQSNLRSFENMTAGSQNIYFGSTATDELV